MEFVKAIIDAIKLLYG